MSSWLGFLCQAWSTAHSSSSSKQGGAALGMVWEGSEGRRKGVEEGEEEVLAGKAWGGQWGHPLSETWSDGVSSLFKLYI